MGSDKPLYMKNLKLPFALILSTALLVLSGCNQADDSFYDFQEGIGSEIVLEDYESAQYFTFKKDYSCVLSSGQVVSSFKDSLYFSDEKVCRTGDLCSRSVDCIDKAEVADLEMFDGNFKVKAFGDTYVYGADLNDNGGAPNFESERRLASTDRGPDGYEDPTRKNIIIIYAFWIMAIAMTWYNNDKSQLSHDMNYELRWKLTTKNLN